MSDLPDWVTATNNAGTTIFQNVIAGGQSNGSDTTNTQTLAIAVTAAAAVNAICIRVRWFDTIALGNLIQTNYFTAIGQPSSVAKIDFETPVYGGAVVIDNLTAFNLTVVIVASSRTITAPRVLDSNTPTRVFNLTGNFVAGTFPTVPAIDGLGNGYANNAQVSLGVDSNTAGGLYFQYVDSTGTARNQTLASIPANTHVNLTIALAQGIGIFVFDPTANNAAGNCAIFAAPAQL